MSHARAKGKGRHQKGDGDHGRKNGTGRHSVAPDANGRGSFTDAGTVLTLSQSVQPQLVIGPVDDPYEREADSVAERVTTGRPGSPQGPGGLTQRQPLEEPVQMLTIWRQVSEEEESIQRQAAVEEEPVQALFVRRQVTEEEEAVQRQAVEEEPIQRQAVTEEEPVQALFVRRQAAEDEEPVQRQAAAEEEPVQALFIRRQVADEEEPVQRQAAEDEEPVQRQAAAEEEPVQALFIRRQVADEEEPVQRQAAEDEEPVQRQATTEEEPVQAQMAPEDEPIQRAANGRPRVSANTASTIRNPGAGQPMAPGVRGQIEPHVGADLGDVRVHSGSNASRAAGNIGARAFTHGSHIFLGGGESSSDVGLMAHEATHVVQQGAAGAVPDVQPLLGVIGEFLNDYAVQVPGYTLFTVIIGYNPLLSRRVERNATNLVHGLLGLLGPIGNFIFNKLQEYNILQPAFDWVSNQLSRLNLTLSRIEDTIEAAYDEASIRYSFSRNLAIVRRHFGRLYDDVVAFVRTLVDHIMEMIKEAAIAVAERFLAENRAWDLIKKILGEDPLRGEPVDATPAEILEDFLLLIGKEEELRQMKERETLEETANWLATQISTFMSLLGELRGLISSAWDAIQPENLPDLADNLRNLATQVGGFLQRVWDFAITVAAKVLELIKKALLNWLSDFAHEVPGFHLLTVLIERNPFTGEAVPRTPENLIRGFITLLPGGNQIYDQLAESGVIAGAAGRIESAISELGISWPFIVDLFTGIWNSLSINDLIDPIGAFTRIRDQYGEPISRLFRFIAIVIREIVYLILEMMGFPFDLIGSIISNAMQAIEDIKNDPVGFIKNMLRAVKLGFSNFFDNILQHLLGGLADWLFRGLRDAGIEPPDLTSLESILDFALEVMGISMDRIWEKLADRIGQETVDRIRGAIDRLVGIWNFVRDVQERGIAAVWEYIEGQITGLWDMVLEKAQEWIMERVINRAIQWLLSLLDPTGIMPVINSFMAFFRAVQSAIEYLRDILGVINDYVTTVAAIARGEIQPGAEKLEQGLANIIPIAIGFLAKQFGLDNISETIQNIVNGLRGLVDRALDWLIDRAVSMVQSVLRAIGIGGDEEEQAEEPEDVDPEVAAQVTAGLAAIPEKEAPFLSEGKLTREEAEQVAIAVRQEHSIFRVFQVVDGEDSWNYHYEVNPGGEVEGSPKAKPPFPTEPSQVSVEVSKIKEEPQFKGKIFKMRELKDYMMSNYSMARTTTNQRIALLKELGLLFVSESERAGESDRNKDVSFDEDLISAVRTVAPPSGNRNLYGYINPQKDRPTGREIMVKGLIKEAQYGYAPGKENDINYLKTQARFFDSKHSLTITWAEADLGHGDVSATDHWQNGGGAGPHNDPGHTQQFSQNRAWNQNSENFHGPEEKHLNRADNTGTFITPGPPNHPESHPMWWDPTHPEYVG